MSEILSKVHNLLADVIVPHLKGIQASQSEQRLQTERLHHSLDEFRGEIQIRLAEIRAEIAACRQELEDTMATLRESDAVEMAESGFPGKKRLIH
jgi:uncharacterized membrane protein